jgi:hypothetical protein
MARREWRVPVALRSYGEDGGRFARAARTNLDEHERIRQAIDKLREAQLDMNASVLSLMSAIGDLVDGIPPENLR